jgi:hypothetical protein
MKKTLLILINICCYYNAKAQATISPLEKALTDSICNCLVKVDIDKITNKQEATAAFTDCFARRTDLLMKLADEKHIEAGDNVGMRGLGLGIAKDLLNQNCVAFTRISVKMVQGESEQKDLTENFMTGTFKRIDLKGFNYIVLENNSGGETSFLWLEQFSGSEKFMNGPASLIGKKLKIKYNEREVYLPVAKGYYKVKEILAVDFL